MTTTQYDIARHMRRTSNRLHHLAVCGRYGVEKVGSLIERSLDADVEADRLDPPDPSDCYDAG